MYILTENAKNLKNGSEVLGHKLKMNNVHKYEYIPDDKLKIKETEYFNLYEVRLVK